MSSQAAQIVEAHTPPSLDAYYSQLRAAESPRELAATLQGSLAPLVEQARADRERAQTVLRECEQRVIALERLAAAADAIVEDRPVTDIGLHGRQIADAAIRVARGLGRSELHYREWFDLFRQAGHVIDATKPEDSFLTALTRHPLVESAGARSGVYRILEDDQ